MVVVKYSFSFENIAQGRVYESLNGNKKRGKCMDVFKMISKLLVIMFFAQSALAHEPMALTNNKTVSAIADLNLLKQVGAQISVQDAQMNLGYASLTPAAQNQLSLLAHKAGKCGGYEVVQDASILEVKNITFSFQFLKQKLMKDLQYARNPIRVKALPQRPEITQALAQADEKNLLTWVNWLSAFPNRYNKDPNPNNHVLQLKTQLEKMMGQARARGLSGTIELIDHKSTLQKSLHVVIPGKTRPQESVVLGAHLDSISFSGSRAPGSDDNASGSSNLIEALRILLAQPQPARTIEFFWYAGEESGLLGSAEIAAAYKKQNRNVVGVLQLDMTLFPGGGELVIGSMTDFTSSWMRELMADLNRNYLNVKIVDDKCGYGCSDHASWYRQGYPTLIPFEATMDTMNQRLHTDQDIVTPQMSFKHSLVFTKIAIALAMELGNNLDLHQPY